jgi:DNA primase
MMVTSGCAGSKRAIEILLAEDLEVKVLVLPDGADPDEFVKHAARANTRNTGETHNPIQFVIDQAVKDRNLYRPARRLRQ